MNQSTAMVVLLRMWPGLIMVANRDFRVSGGDREGRVHVCEERGLVRSRGAKEGFFEFLMQGFGFKNGSMMFLVLLA